MNIEKYKGCFWGLAIGDAFGAPYESGIIERLFWRCIGKTLDGKLRYTDDTQMSIDLARSILINNGVVQEHLSESFAASYHWSRGYGPATAEILKYIKRGRTWCEVNKLRYEEGSMGNGAAMRAPIISLCYPYDQHLLMENVIKASEITHVHPLAIEGAKLVSYTVLSCLNDMSVSFILKGLESRCASNSFSIKMEKCIDLFEPSESVSTDEISRILGNSTLATNSCVTAIFFGLSHINKPFDELLANVLQIRGDVDTIASMACAIWGAKNGSKELEKYIVQIENSNLITQLAIDLANRFLITT